MVASIVVDGVSTCVLLYSMSDLSDERAMQCSLIWELKFSEFKLDYNTAEVMKNICYAKGESTVDHSTARNFAQITRILMIWEPDRHEVMLQVIEVNPVSSTPRVSGKIDILQLLGKGPSPAELYFMLPKNCRTFDSPS